MSNLVETIKDRLNGLRKRSYTVRSRIIFCFIVIAAVPCIVLGMTAYVMQKDVLTTEAFQSQTSELDEKLKDLDTYLNEVKVDAEEMSDRFTMQKLVEAISNREDEAEVEWFRHVREDITRFGNLRKRYVRIQLLDNTGQETIRIDFEGDNAIVQPPNKLRNLAGKPYVEATLGLTRDEAIIIPLLSHNPQIPKDGFESPVIRCGRPVFTPAGIKVGIVILTAKADRFLSQFGSVPKGKGRMMLIDPLGYFLYHPYPEMQQNWAINQNNVKFQEYYDNDRILQDMLEKQIGMVKDHSDEFLAYQKIMYNTSRPSDFWIGIYTQKKSDVIQPVNDFKVNFLWQMLVTAVLVFIFGIYQVQLITRPLQQVVDVAKSIGRGDLNVNKLNYDTDDEIGILASTFDSMVDTLRASINSMANAAEELTDSSRDISSSLQEQSSIVAEQSTSLTQITATLEELSTSSTQIADNADSVVDISAGALGQAELGVTSIEEIKSKMDEIADDNRGSVREIVELGKKSKEIGKVMEIINNIADQTKLIAFNAAIEASSAGEAGKRFGVVAVEIRRLADNVMSSTGEIESRIEEIQQAIHGLVIDSEKGAKRIAEGTGLAAETLSKLESLVEGATSTNEAADQISHSIQQQKTATGQVVSALKEIEQGIQQTSVSIKQTTTVTRRLTDSSNVLQNLVDNYSVDQTRF